MVRSHAGGLYAVTSTATYAHVPALQNQQFSHLSAANTAKAGFPAAVS